MIRNLTEVYEALTRMYVAQEEGDARDLLHEATETDWYDLSMKLSEAMHLLEDMPDDND